MYQYCQIFFIFSFFVKVLDFILLTPKSNNTIEEKIQGYKKGQQANNKIENEIADKIIYKKNKTIHNKLHKEPKIGKQYPQKVSNENYGGNLHFLSF